MGDSGHVDLLVSLLIKYPHITSVQYNSTGVLKLSFMIHNKGQKCYNDFVKLIHEHLNSHAYITGYTIKHLTLRKVDCSTLQTIEIERDVSSLTNQELYIIASLVLEQFTEYLVIDECAVYEDYHLKDVSEPILPIKNQIHKEKLIGMRAQGKVLVFSQPEYQKIKA